MARKRGAGKKGTVEHGRAGDTREREVVERERTDATQALLAAIIDSSDDAIIGKTLDGVITSWNKGAERLYGYSESEAVGKLIEIIVPPDRMRELGEVLDKLRHGGRVEHHETVRATKDGRRIDVSITISPIFDQAGHIVGAATITRDITEQKRIEKELKRAEEFTHSTLDSLPLNIAVLDGEGNIIFANRQWMEFGLENDVCPVESIGVGANYFNVCRGAEGPHSDEAPAALEGMLSVLNGEKDTFELEYPCHSPDKKRWFIMRVAPIRAGPFNGIIVTHTDITRRKLSEEALADEKARAELYVDLMGHDINNMNHLSLGFLEMAHNIIEINGKLGESDIALLDRAMDSLRNSSQIIDNVRKLQREMMGLYEPEVIDVGGMAEDAVKQFRGTPGRDIRVTVDVRDHCLVRANALLKDVFVNLVGNAVKHSRGDLVVNVHVYSVIDNGKAYCRIDVEDNGPGIPDQLKETLFDRLNLTSTRAKGKGFGLCLIKMLVDDYQGKFWVEDRIKGDYSKGARFVVLLPAIEK